MLSIEEILKISNDMGLEVVNSSDGKHYIFDDNNQKCEFDVDMLMSIYRKESSFKLDIQISNKLNFDMSSSSYNFPRQDNLYVSASVNINESMIVAA